MRKEQREAIGWAALGRVAGKEARRQLLKPGKTPFELNVRGSIGGEPWRALLSGELVVAEDTERTTSKLPPMEHLLGVVLSWLGPRKREELVKGLLEDYAAADHRLPEVDVAIVELAKRTLQQLRASTTSQVAGSVSAAYQLGRL